MKGKPASRKTEHEGCTVIVFPMRWRKGTVRRVAETFLAKKPVNRTHFWNRTLDTLERQLERIGCTDDDISQELRAFTAAVQAEVYRIQGHASGPDGAA